VDFNYEVSRSLSACEGALLVIDAAQGVEAQTLSNAYLAIDNDLEIIPVINKIDLPAADIERAKQELEEIIGLDSSVAVLTSAKNGVGIRELLQALVDWVPPPSGDPQAPVRALICDSWFDSYRGVTALVRVVDGRLTPRSQIRLMATGELTDADEVGVFSPFKTPAKALEAGEVGYVVTGIKSVHGIKIGDTITLATGGAKEPLPGFKNVKPMVFAGLFPSENADYEMVRDAIEKLALNDASFSVEPESSDALGFGWRCGFLGLLHMEIVQERLEREYDCDLITTAPTAVCKVKFKDGTEREIENPSQFPDPNNLLEVSEPYIAASIHVPNEHVGAVLALCEQRRGIQKDMRYLGSDRVAIHYELPLNEVVTDFFDKLKSNTRGYASLDYEMAGFRVADLVRLDILVNGARVDALSAIVHRTSAYERGKALASRLKDVINRQQFEVAIQAALGTKIIARTTVKALRKNVTAKCYGGDISRKRKLLEKQKAGKKRMKQVGNVELPQDAFLAVLKLED
jgi:GTP-binding protein LepA